MTTPTSLPEPRPEGGDRAERLDAERCMALLAEAPNGHLAASVHALPAVMPGRHTVDGERLFVRCPDEAFLRACSGTVVAFSADRMDGEELSGGWVVQVVGECRLVTDGPGGGVLLRIDPQFFDGRYFDG